MRTQVVKDIQIQGSAEKVRQAVMTIEAVRASIAEAILSFGSQYDATYQEVAISEVYAHRWTAFNARNYLVKSQSEAIARFIEGTGRLSCRPVGTCPFEELTRMINAKRFQAGNRRLDVSFDIAEPLLDCLKAIVEVGIDEELE
jgi:hypothetical protein